MKTLYKTFVFILTFIILNSLFVIPAKAVCPVCTVAVAGGLGISRVLGISDAVTGIWIGGLMLSFSFWIANKFKKLPLLLVIIFVYALTLLPLHFTNQLQDLLRKSIVLGSVGFLTGVFLDKYQRKVYGKQFFVYQKVVFPVTILVLLSLWQFIITKTY